MVKREVLYFDESSPDNTEETIGAVKVVIDALKLKYVIVATGTGSTGVKVAEAFKGTGVKVVVVTEYAGSVDLVEKNLKKIRELGGEVVTSMHSFLSVEESIPRLHPGYTSGNVIVSDTLRRFSQGTKVAAEIAMMATDAGAVPEGVEVAAMAGTGGGCDTAYVLKSCHANMFFDREKGLEFREIISLPRKKKFW